MQIALDVPSILEQDQAAILSDQMLSFEWAGKLSGTFRLPMEYCQLACGDVVSFDNEPNVHWLIQRVTLTEYVTLEVRSINKPKPVALAPSLPLLPSTNADQGYFGAPPHIVTMDLPLIDGATVKDQLRVATVSQPQAAQSIYISPLDYGYDFRQTVEQNATIGSTVNALPTSFSGRWDYGSYLDVALISGAFESREDAFIFAGYNALAVKSEKDTWEIIQFANAEEIEPDVWRLSKLLRGQLGTEDGLLSGVPAGADVVLLDDTVVPIGLSDAEIGLELNARIGPSGKEFTDRYFNTVAIQGGLRSQLPLAPVHLTMSNGGSELQFSWIRRSRLKADNWLPADIPLGEDTEEYQVTILNAAGDEVLQRSVSETSLTVQHSEIGNASGEVVLRVAQISQQVGEGVPAQANFTIT